MGPCSVAGHVPTLPWVRSRVWVRVGLESGLASGKGWVGTWLDLKSKYDILKLLPVRQTVLLCTFYLICNWELISLVKLKEHADCK